MQDTDAIYAYCRCGRGHQWGGHCKSLLCGRGLSVCVCEKDDLASHTSSASSKLIHGGLRLSANKRISFGA